MKKTITLTFTLFALFNLSIGQAQNIEYDIKWGMETKVSKRYHLADVIGHDETGFYVLKLSTKSNYSIGPFSTNRTPNFFIERYNHGINLDRMSEINLDKYDLERVVQLGENLYVFSSLTANNDKNNSLYVQSINKQNLKINPEFVEVANINFKGNRKSNSGAYRYRISRNRSILLALCMLPYEKHESEKMAIKVLNEDMGLMWSKDIDLPYTDELFKLQDLHIDDQGNVFILGKVYHEKLKSKVDGAPNYHYTILSYKEKGESFKEYKVSLPDQFLKEMKISTNSKGDIICAGFYSENNKAGIKGAYYLTVDATTNAIKHKSFKDFHIEFVVQDMSEGKQKKLVKASEKGKTVEMYNYLLDDIIVKEDGGAVLVGEQYFYRVVTQTTTTPNGGMTTTSYTKYYYNDIIVVSIDGSGDIDWANKIPKRQMTINDGGFYSSYAMAVVRDKLYFVFNDHAKNMAIGKEGKPIVFSSGKEAVAVLVEVSSDGSILKKALFKAKDAGALARPKVCEQISEHEMIIFCQLRKTHRFAKIDFGDYSF